ncbi:MAG: M56 family metallopeptidase, partial [Spongiibacteraceae bacterium]
CTLGLFRPTIYLSQGLIRQLPAAAISAITAHEHAHVQRRDNLWLILLRASCLFWIRRNKLFDDIELAHDQSCDRAAADFLGDYLTVAETLVQCRRLGNSPPLAASFLRNHLALRVQAILHSDDSTISPVRVLCMATLLLLTVATLVPLLHYAIELLWSLRE